MAGFVSQIVHRLRRRSREVEEKDVPTAEIESDGDASLSIDELSAEFQVTDEQVANADPTFESDTTEDAPRDEHLFKYKELDRDADEIRLLRLSPDPANSQLCCDVRHFSLSNTPNYMALSYAWRDDALYSAEILAVQNYLYVEPDMSSQSPGSSPTNNEKSTQNFRWLPIATNLAAFLKAHRKSKKSDTWLWIDAICINQKDTDERNLQVLRMSQIYQNAVKVLVWLGPQSQDSRTAIQYLKWLADHLKARDKPEEKYWPNWDQSDIAWLENEMSKRSHVSEWIAIKSLMTRQWFKRLWTVQEVVLAKKVLFWCGNDKFSWSELVIFDSVTKVSSHVIDEHTMHAIGRVKVLRLKWQGRTTLEWLRSKRDGEGITLYKVLVETMFYHCTNNRDQIYGVLAIASDSMEICPNPDYKLSVRETKKRVLQSSFNYYQNLDLLSLICFRRPANSKADLFKRGPLWSQNFPHAKPPDFKKSFGLRLKEERKLKASGSLTPQIVDCDKEDKLVLRGFIFDTVAGVGLNPRASSKLINSKTKTSAYENMDEAFTAFYLAILDADNVWSRGEERLAQCHLGRRLLASKLHSLANLAPSITADVELLDEKTMSHDQRLSRWYTANREFEIAGVTLEQLAKHVVTVNEGEPQRNEKIQLELDRRIRCLSIEDVLATTEKGYVGKMPREVQPEDLVVILFGGKLPFILRAWGDEFILLRFCNVPGIMHGEAVRDYENGRYEAREFTLI